jgi:hypothetical protein
MRVAWLCAAVLACACGAGAPRAASPEMKMRPPTPAADLVLVGGTVWTMDPLRPRADGIAIAGGHVEAVGSDAEIRARIGPRTRVIELAGRSVSPGLVDGHCHLSGLGKALETLSLRGVTSIEEVAARVEATAAGRAPDEWIEGRNWDQNLWKVKEFPGAGLLDGVPNPVALRRVDGHSLWVNGPALRIAGVTRATADPPGGKIVRDARGEPTGVLVDAAMALVDTKIPPAPPDVIRRRIEAAQAAAVKAGLTGVHEMGIGDDVVAVYRQMAADGTLRLRVHALLTGAGHMGELPGRRPDRDPDGTSMFVLAGVKLYADGSLGSRSALLLAPYSDDPQNRGLVVNDEAQLIAGARAALAGGWQLAVHAIGDGGNRNVLDAYRAAGVPADRRFRIEHAQVVAPSDFARFAAQGVIASMQPTHATSDMPWAEARLGAERARGAYAWRTMLAAGAHVLAGSDFPVEEVPPIWGLWAAVSRQDRDRRPPGGWFPDQRLTLDEALRAYTVEAAYASFQEAHRGKLAPGFVADVTVYDRNLVAEHLLDARAAMTIVGGTIVHDAAR